MNTNLPNLPKFDVLSKKRSCNHIMMILLKSKNINKLNHKVVKRMIITVIVFVSKLNVMPWMSNVYIGAERDHGYLCNADAERIFSKGRALLTEYRSNLSAENVNDMLTLSSNSSKIECDASEEDN
jgi:hypothetical protein